MALVKCRECGTSVSSKAKKCPHCGVSDPFRVKVRRSIIVVGITVLIASLFVIGLSSGKPTAAGTATQPSDGAEIDSGQTPNKIPDIPVFYMPRDGRISDNDKWAEARIINFTAMQHIAAIYGKCKLISEYQISKITEDFYNFQNMEENITIYRKYNMSDNDIINESNKIVNFDSENHNDFYQCSSIIKTYVNTVISFINSGDKDYDLDNMPIRLAQVSMVRAVGHNRQSCSSLSSSPKNPLTKTGYPAPS